MSRRKKIWLTLLGVLVIAAALAYYPLLRADPGTANCSYSLDLDRARQLAASMPGAKPTHIRVEHVLTTSFPLGIVSSGQSWTMSPIPVYAYQLVFPDRTIVIDTAMTRAIAARNLMAGEYDDAAWKRLRKGMESAESIYITHEHFDHLGGAYPEGGEAIAARLRLTPEQLAATGIAFVVTPASLRATMKPLEYTEQIAVAPGVVLIRAPGHTPGSQMVFIQKADGTEVLLLGDTAWQTIAIDTLRGPPALPSPFLKSTRTQLACELKALQQARTANPKLEMVPGHDGVRMQALQASGVLTAGFAE